MDDRIYYVEVALKEIDPVDEREDRSIDEFEHLLPTLDFPFDREKSLIHVTAGGLILGTQGVVLHKHKKLGIWIQTGGHIDEGEYPYEAALRESTEETGLELSHWKSNPTLIHVDVHEAGDHIHLDMRYLLSSQNELINPDAGESQDVKWFSWDEAFEIAEHESMDGLLKSAKYFYSKT